LQVAEEVCCLKVPLSPIVRKVRESLKKAKSFAARLRNKMKKEENPPQIREYVPPAVIPPLSTHNQTKKLPCPEERCILKVCLHEVLFWKFST